MRGQKRTYEEKNELFNILESYLEMGFSLKKACSYTNLPYSTMKDIVDECETLRAKTIALQNKVNVKARENIIKSINEGNIRDSKWWIVKFDDLKTEDKDFVKERIVSEIKWVVMDGSEEPKESNFLKNNDIITV